jgi:hypothetical protein
VTVDGGVEVETSAEETSIEALITMKERMASSLKWFEAQLMVVVSSVVLITR